MEAHQLAPALCLIVISLLCCDLTTSFLSKPKTTFQRPTSLNMCICIDCARVTNCAAYHFVETNHEQPHITENPTFEPRDGNPTIHVTIRTEEERQAESRRMGHGQETKETVAHGDDFGKEKYDLSSFVSTEYDVVKCEDFVLDKGNWIRNMPEEIRKANPNFVPS